MTDEMRAKFLKMLAISTIAKAAKTNKEAAMLLKFNPYYIIDNGLTIEDSNKSRCKSNA